MPEHHSRHGFFELLAATVDERRPLESQQHVEMVVVMFAGMSALGLPAWRASGRSWASSTSRYCSGMLVAMLLRVDEYTGHPREASAA